MTNTKISVLAAAVLGLAWVAPVGAQPYVNGFSGGQANFLDINTAGGPVSLSTTQSEINSGQANEGWWSGTYPNTFGNANYFTGSPNGADWLNSYYIFNLGLLGGATATSATLVIDDTAHSGTPPFNLSFWDVSTPATTLLAYSTPTSTAIYNDLGSGIEYGSLAYNGSGTITVTLDQAALNAINSQGGYFAIGATLSPSASVPDSGMTLGLLGMCVSGLMALKRKL
jgi:hypothetical protein